MCPLKRIKEALPKKWNLVILDIPDKELKEGKLDFILMLHCKSKAPILAIANRCSEKDYWMLEEMGVEKCIERPLIEAEFKEKLAFWTISRLSM